MPRLLPSLLFYFALLFSISGIGQSSSTTKREPILGQYLNAETVIDGNAKQISNKLIVDGFRKDFYYDKKGRVYIKRDGDLLKLSEDLSSFEKILTGKEYSDYIGDLVFDKDNNIFITFTDIGAVKKLNQETKILEKVSIDNLKFTTTIKIDSDGNLLILNSGGVYKWNIKENKGTLILTEKDIGIPNYIYYYASITLDSFDNIYLLDTINSKILKFKKGEKIGVIEAETKKYQYTPSIAVDKENNIFLADTYNHQILKWEKGNLNSKIIIDEKDIIEKQPISPGNISIDENNEVFFSDTANVSLIKIDKIDNSISVIFEGQKPLSDANQLNFPIDIFVGKSNELYVKDSNNNRVQKFKNGSNIGETLFIAEWGPIGIDLEENFYLNDNLKRSIKKWDKITKSFSNVAGGNGAGLANNQISNLNCFYISNNNDIYVGDYGNKRIQKWSRNAKTGTSIAENINPYLIKIDNDSTIYISVYDNGYTIKKLEKNSKIWESLPIVSFSDPNDLQLGGVINFELDENKSIYVLDKDKILKWKSNSITPEYVFGQKIGSNSKLNYPKRFTIAPNGDIYIADTGNNRILKVNPNVKIVEKSASQKTLTEYNGAYFLTQTNDLIAKIIPDEANMAMGEVTASVVVDATQDQSFVKRHYKIETNNPAHKSKISLYFTQAELNQYNNLNDKKLPISPTDKTGIANVIVTSSKISTGRRAFPLQTTIEIPDNQIVWNENLSLWEISFEDTGSNEYWLKTKFEYKQSTFPKREFPIFTKKNLREGVEEMEVFEANSFEIYPNPVSKAITLKINDSKLIGTNASIKNEVGISFKNHIINKSIEPINVESWPAGIYFIEFANGKVGKFLKE